MSSRVASASVGAAKNLRGLRSRRQKRMRGSRGAPRRWAPRLCGKTERIRRIVVEGGGIFRRRAVPWQPSGRRRGFAAVAWVVIASRWAKRFTRWSTCRHSAGKLGAAVTNSRGPGARQGASSVGASECTLRDSATNIWIGGGRCAARWRSTADGFSPTCCPPVKYQASGCAATSARMFEVKVPLRWGASRPSGRRWSRPSAPDRQSAW
jgi:hypothetical protein